MYSQNEPLTMIAVQQETGLAHAAEADQACLVASASLAETRSPSPLAAAVLSAALQDSGKKRVYTAKEVGGRTDIFIAGRGGVTNIHLGNKVFRQRALEHADKYRELRPCERGRRYARNLLEQHFADVTFVVARSYFFKNIETISKEKIRSVQKEHGGRLDDLEGLPADNYFTVGETWVLGIISDIVRLEAARRGAFGSVKTPKNNKKKRATAPAAISDDESAEQQRCERPPPSKRARKSAKVTKTDLCIVPSVLSNEITLLDAKKKARLSSDEREEGPENKLDGLDALMKWPLLALDDDVYWLDNTIQGDETLFDVLRELGS